MDENPEVNQPGLAPLREAVATHLGRYLPGRRALGRDALAGLNGAVSSVPDGMASGILAGVNPLYGLYAAIVGPIAGGVFSSTQLMVVTTTSAASLAAGQALTNLPPGARDDALFLMVVLIGVFQIVLGALQMGRLSRFVSYSVMTGFVTGIAVLTVLSQLPTITGYDALGSNKVGRTWNLLMNLGQVDGPSLAVSALTLALAVTLPRTRLGASGTVLAIAVASLSVVLFHLASVQVVRDVGEIPRGVPLPHLPSLAALNLDVLTGALAVAANILVQGAGVSQSVPNPDGTRTSASRDFIGQGAANLACGFFRGLPVGGSLSTTALTVSSGARTRWAAILSGVYVGIIVIAAPGLVSRVAMPALGMLLIIASAGAIRVDEAISVWLTGWPSRIAAVSTFLATLFLPIQAAVGIGVALSALLYIGSSSVDVSVTARAERPDGRVVERKAPKTLPARSVTVLNVYGHLFYAGARTLERMLPPPDGPHPAVILRLRGRNSLGATLIEVLNAYADRLNEAGGRLYLSGVTEAAYDDIVRTGKLHNDPAVHTYRATEVIGESTRKAVADAEAWLAEQPTSPDSGSA
jgi:SulP family sulfate permease